MTREEALNVIWLRCQHNDKTYEAYCVLKHEQQPCDDATLKDIFCMGCEYKEQEPCDKCVYSTSEGCQYDDITETIPPFETSDDAIRRQAVLDLLENTNNGWIINKVLQLPPVNPQKQICPSAGVDCEDCPAYEPKTGHWIEYEKGYWSQVNEEGERDGWVPAYECSECGSQGWMDKENYCPNCGAKMTEEDKA